MTDAKKAAGDAVTSKQTRRREQSPLPPGEMLDPDFDELGEANNEFTAWRWPTPERSM